MASGTLTTTPGHAGVIEALPRRCLRRPGSARTRHRSEIRRKGTGDGDLLKTRPWAARPKTGAQGGSACLAPRAPGPARWNPRREEITTSQPTRYGADGGSPGGLLPSLIRPRPTGSRPSSRRASRPGQPYANERVRHWKACWVHALAGSHPASSTLTRTNAGLLVEGSPAPASCFAVATQHSALRRLRLGERPPRAVAL